MAQEEATPPSAIQSPTPQQIATAAQDLNLASHELGVSISAIETFLESRNIGVPAWVRVKGWSDAHGEYWSRELGYERLGSTWRIAIRETSGHEAYENSDRTDTWAFNSSPRKARISAVDKIPELLHELVKESERTARRLREKAAEVTAFVASLNIAPPAQKAKK